MIMNGLEHTGAVVGIRGVGTVLALNAETADDLELVESICRRRANGGPFYVTRSTARERFRGYGYESPGGVRGLRRAGFVRPWGGDGVESVYLFEDLWERWLQEDADNPKPLVWK